MVDETVRNQFILGPDAVRAFWSGVMVDEHKGTIVHKLKASELLARSYGMFREATVPLVNTPSPIDEALDRLSTDDLLKLVYDEK